MKTDFSKLQTTLFSLKIYGGTNPTPVRRPKTSTLSLFVSLSVSEWIQTTNKQLMTKKNTRIHNFLKFFFSNQKAIILKVDFGTPKN